MAHLINKVKKMKKLESMKDIIGLTVAAIEGGEEGSDKVIFRFTDGNVITMLHDQDCCEEVRIYETDGDIQDLVGGVVVQFDESTSEDNAPDDCCESWTWTFYNIATARGFVNMRWLGESNGYYSEAVDVLTNTGRLLNG